ncbi:MAG TPA: GntP family permease [Firmicutes bacterium]|nr:GntP family permease [Bacillota bacterium]
MLVLPIGLILFAWLAYQRWSAVVLGPLVSLVVLLLARVPMFKTMTGPYMETAASYFKNYFLIFFLGALFSAIYEETGAAESIAKALLKVTKGAWAASMVMLITGLLTYGGISGFVIFFAMYPITWYLFKEANLPQRIIPAAISAGTWTWSMTSPGTPAIQNVIPMRYLGTPSTAALVPGIISGVLQFVLIFLYLEWRTRLYLERGLNFSSEGPQELTHKSRSDAELPNPWIAVIPPIVVLLLFNVAKLAVETAVFVGILLGLCLLWKHGGNYRNWVKVLNRGGANSAMAILNTALVAGFAGAVRAAPGYAKLISSLKNLRMPPLVFVAVTVALAAGAAGSASGGMSVALESLKDTYMSLGVPLQYVHRVTSIAAGTLDTLPHQGAQITLLTICGLTHKEGYFDIAMTQLVIPTIALIVIIPLCMMGL